MIRRVDLGSFKSFRKAGINLAPLTLVVGSNASGKSNLGDALRMLHAVGLGFSWSEALDGKYGPGGIRQWSGVRGGAHAASFNGIGAVAMGLVLEAGALGYMYNFALITRGETSPPRSIFEELTGPPRPNTRTNGLAPVFSASEGGLLESTGPKPLSQPLRHSLRLNLMPTARPAIPFEVASTTSALSQLARLPGVPPEIAQPCTEVLHELQSLRFLDLHPDAMREASPPGQTILGDRGENLSSVLLHICTDPARKEGLLSWVRALTPMDVNDISFKSDFSGRILAHLVEADGREVSAVSASDGTLRFLALVAALLSPETGQIFFFDEIDTGIHPARLHLLLDLLREVTREGRTPRVQVIATTHNPALLALLNEQERNDVVLAYRPEGAPDTRLKRLRDLPDLDRVLENDDLGQLFASGWLEHAAAFSEPDPPGEGG